MIIFNVLQYDICNTLFMHTQNLKIKTNFHYLHLLVFFFCVSNEMTNKKKVKS